MEESIDILKRYMDGEWIQSYTLEGSLITVIKQAEKAKRYENALNFGVKYLANSDVRQVQLVRNALKEALDS